VFHLLGIYIGRTQPEKEADSILTIQCLDRVQLGIQEHTPGFLAIPKNRVIAKSTNAPELIPQLDTQQQQQQQQSLFGFR
jgi:hypothetical protein